MNKCGCLVKPVCFPDTILGNCYFCSDPVHSGECFALEVTDWRLLNDRILKTGARIAHHFCLMALADPNAQLANEGQLTLFDTENEKRG